MSFLTAPKSATLAALLAAWCAALFIYAWPGHISLDTAVQISEGRSRVFESFNPPWSSLFMASMTQWTGDTSLLVLASALMLAWGSYHLLTTHLRNPLWAAPWLALMLAGPIFMIYPGIVWKDVHYAHLALCSFALIGIARSSNRTWLEYTAIALLAVAATQRQQGLLVAVLVCFWAGISSTTSRSLRSATVATLQRLTVVIAVTVVAAVGVKFVAKSMGVTSARTGITQSLIYDMVGIVNRVPDARLEVLEREKLDVAAFRRDAINTYIPSRIDTLGPGASLFHVNRDAIALEQWLKLVWDQPRAFIGHKIAFLSWFGGMQDQQKCAPVHVGYGPEAPMLAAAGLQASYASPLSTPAYMYAQTFVNTPYFALWLYAAITLISMGLLAVQKRWRSAWFGLQLCALAYVSSFAVLGLACDFRYGYFLVVTGSLSAVYMLASGFGFRLPAVKSP